ncbi:MAG: glutamate 5-kinase [bacterium]|jgi:glutamate 5-kinase
MRKKRILVKVGTNVLTRPNLRLDYNRISDLVEQLCIIKDEYDVIFVSSGAVGAGREFSLFTDEPDPLIRKQMLASVGQGRLFQVYADFFKEYSVMTAQALLTQGNFSSKDAYSNIKNTLEGLLRNDVLPIINENDVVSNEEVGFGDNDQLAALTAALMEADILVILSDIQGFFTADPKRDPSAKLIPVVEKITPELMTLCEETISTGGTGGMYSKIKAAEIATKHGIHTIIASGKEKNSLIKAVQERSIGTFFRAVGEKKLGTKGAWMNSGIHFKGVITIDAGAEKALHNNKSLLAVGVHRVQGSFQKNDVVLVQNKNKIRIGAGLAKVDSKQIKNVLGNEQAQGLIAIHTNNLYMLN